MDNKEENMNNCGHVSEAGPDNLLTQFSHSQPTSNLSTQYDSTGDQQEPLETTITEIKIEPNLNFKTELSVESEDAMSDEDLDSDVPLLQNTGQEKSAPFSCCYCTYRFSSVNHLNKHMRIKHSVRKKRQRFSCPHCNFVTHKGDYLPIHIKIHTGEKPYSCNVCDYKCIQKSSLTMHMQRHSREKPHFCHICDYTTKVRIDLNKHVKEKHNEVNTILACDACPYKCKTPKQLMDHYRNGTGDDNPYACTICSHRFQRKTSLDLHLKLHPELNYSCPLCSFTTVVEDKYNKHFEAHAK